MKLVFQSIFAVVDMIKRGAFKHFQSERFIFLEVTEKRLTVFSVSARIVEQFFHINHHGHSKLIETLIDYLPGIWNNFQPQFFISFLRPGMHRNYKMLARRFMQPAIHNQQVVKPYVYAVQPVFRADSEA